MLQLWNCNWTKKHLKGGREKKCPVRSSTSTVYFSFLNRKEKKIQLNIRRRAENTIIQIAEKLFFHSFGKWVCVSSIGWMNDFSSFLSLPFPFPFLGGSAVLKLPTVSKMRWKNQFPYFSSSCSKVLLQYTSLLSLYIYSRYIYPCVFGNGKPSPFSLAFKNWKPLLHGKRRVVVVL